MSEPAIRGSWNVTAAIAQQWASEGLDDKFRQVWPVALRVSDQHFPLNDGEDGVKAETPYPYCTFYQGQGVLRGRSSGLVPNQSIEYWDIPIQFKVYHEDKDLARDFIKLVMAAFDNKPLPVLDDGWINTQRGADFPVQEGEEQWSWAVSYTIQIDAHYLTKR